jgi:hypothetical protein
MSRLPAMRHATRLVAGVLALVVTSGCAASPRLFVNREADMTLYDKVAVLPFHNLSGDAYASARVTRAFTTELIIAERFQIVDPAVLSGELERLNAGYDAQGQINFAKLKDAATAVGATAVIRGAVSEYAMRRAGTGEVPVVSFDAEMVDVATGFVVWRISITETGKGRLPIVGGPGERTFARVTQEACRHAVNVLKAKVL